MSINISTLARNNAGDAIVDLIDVGSIMPNGYIEIRSGTKPSSPQIAATGVLLSTNNLSSPAFGTFVNGVAVCNQVGDGTVLTSGSPGWFRIYNKNQQAVIDGDVTIAGGGGDLQFQSLAFLQGGTVTISSGMASMPQ